MQEQEQEQQQKWLQSCVAIMKQVRFAFNRRVDTDTTPYLPLQQQRHAVPLSPSALKGLFSLKPSYFLLKLTRCLRLAHSETSTAAATLCHNLCSTARGSCPRCPTH